MFQLFSIFLENHISLIGRLMGDIAISELDRWIVYPGCLLMNCTSSDELKSMRTNRNSGWSWLFEFHFLLENVNVFFCSIIYLNWDWFICWDHFRELISWNLPIQWRFSSGDIESQYSSVEGYIFFSFSPTSSLFSWVSSESIWRNYRVNRL